jgi:hypothetical protein
MTNYDRYNREERAICAHLFRLLHESLDKKMDSPFGKLIKLILERNVIFTHGPEISNHLDFKNIGIYTEVAIIRDYFNKTKSDPNIFMDKLVTLIMKQEEINTDCKLYSSIGEPLNNPKKTHPKQIRQKATDLKINLSMNETRIYGAVQGMFNAKPDLVLTIDDKLIVIEAKFTEKFDEEQLKRTKNITQVWAELLYDELGFSKRPNYAVIKLGASKFNADITWKDICTIAQDTYQPDDKSRIAFNLGFELLQSLDYEQKS